ncbi:unnamed protein product [Phytophthora fragariaefolia]|uniref:Unnamed protein product n=1 Tax=Phytophthora fragariaefolia TaxID=1490495 RepID=A0A9W6WW64_9STRA|nr:unnamed protein product [Phytophthora fragariaefolia]
MSVTTTKKCAAGSIRTNPHDQAINEPEPPGEEDDDAARDDDRDPEFLIEPANDVEDETKAPSEQAHGQTPRRRSRLPDIAIADESDNESKDENEDEIVTSLNRVKAGDDASAYEALDSGDEPDADDFDKYQQIDGNLDMLDPDSSGLSEDSDSDDTSQRTEELEIRFNVGFIQAIGGLAALDSGKLRSNALREMGKTGYEAAIHVTLIATWMSHTFLFETATTTQD